MLRVALIGAGRHCQGNHAPALRHFASEHPGAVELAAVCDLEAEKAEGFRTEFGFTSVFTDIDAMLDEVEPDAIEAIVPIPAILRTPPNQFQAPLAAGIDVERLTQQAVQVALGRKEPLERLALDRQRIGRVNGRGRALESAFGGAPRRLR